MSSCLQKKFEAELERYVGMLFENRVGANAFEVCLREQSTPVPYLKELLAWHEAAAKARDWFERYGPAHLQPLPLVHYDECEKILCSGDMDRHLVVYYSNSLQRSKFNYLEHPLFFDYARGVLAHPDGPDYLQGCLNCWRNSRPGRCRGSMATSGIRRPRLPARVLRSNNLLVACDFDSQGPFA